MSLRHVSKFFPNPIKEACIKVGIQYRDVPLDGNPHKTALLGEESGQKLGSIKRAEGGICGQVENIKTGQSRLFFSVSEGKL